MDEPDVAPETGIESVTWYHALTVFFVALTLPILGGSPRTPGRRRGHKGRHPTRPPARE